MSNRNSSLRRAREVDVVDADGEIADDAKTRGGGDCHRVEAIAHHAEDAVGVLQLGDQMVVRRRHFVIPHINAGNLREAAQGGIGDGSGDENAFLV
jgi:hypothetical protein